MKRCIAALLAVAISGIAFAQSGYPNRNIRLLVTFPPGGSTDLVARVLSAPLGERLGRPVVVENRPGASGAIAAEVVTKAQPDGHTLLVAGTSSVLGLNLVLLPNLQYDPKDLVPITLLVTSPFIVATSPETMPNVHTVRDLIAAIKAKGDMSFGSGGNASGMHLAGEYFKSLAGLNMTHIPYKGNGPAIQAVAAGQLPVAFVDLGSTSGLIKSGRIRVLAIAAAKRTTLNPDIPTAAETGLPGWEALGSFGLVTTIGTPRPVIDRLNAEVTSILKLPDVRERILATGNEPAPTTPEEFASFAKGEVAKWTRVIKQANIKIEQ
jgi:tripartite-type tricarboxylate transporter receptor subunit TctC